MHSEKLLEFTLEEWKIIDTSINGFIIVSSYYKYGEAESNYITTDDFIDSINNSYERIEIGLFPKDNLELREKYNIDSLIYDTFEYFFNLEKDDMLYLENAGIQKINLICKFLKEIGTNIIEDQAGWGIRDIWILYNEKYKKPKKISDPVIFN